MSSELQVQLTSKPSEADLIYTFDFSNWSAVQASPIVAATPTINPPELDVELISIQQGRKTLFWCRGGVPGTTYRVKVMLTLANGARFPVWIDVEIKDG